MKIAQIAPLWERVTPFSNGGVERTINYLTEALVQREHEVTLFASGDSSVGATVVSGCDQSLRSLGLLPTQYMVYEHEQLNTVFCSAHEFDLIHSHLGYPAFAYANFCQTPVVHTLHRSISAETEPLFIQHAHHNFVVLSKSFCRTDLPLNYQAAIYSAIAVENFNFYPEPDPPHYLAFVGRMSASTGPHLAIEIAKKVGLPLKIAGKIDYLNRHFFEREVLPHIDGIQIQFLGEVDLLLKNELVGRALASLSPITWQEPCSLAMIESMAVGTPVIAMKMGSAPEVIAHRKTGFLYESVDDGVKAVQKVHELDRWACRRHVALQFSVDSMVNDYEDLYYNLVSQRPIHQDLPIAS